MEEAEVKQLISLIESAQLQYEVDETGTVSIVCDPVQLVDVAGIQDADATANGALSDNSILTQHIQSNITIEGAIKNEENDIILKSERENKDGLEEILEEEIEDSKSESHQQNVHEKAIIHPPSDTHSPLQYFVQTADGEIIQVLESLEDVSSGTSVGGAQSLEAITGDGTFTNGPQGNGSDNMEILVVGSCESGDMFLIDTSGKQMTGDNGVSIDSSQVMLKSSEIEGRSDDQLDKPSGIYITNSAASCSVDTEDTFHNTEVTEGKYTCAKSPKFHSDTCNSLRRSPVQKRKFSQISVMAGNALHSNKLTGKSASQNESTVLLKDTAPSSSSTIVEGSVVETEKGKMKAFSLSSMTTERASKKTSMQSIASSFGPWVKVLKPVEQEKDMGSSAVKERFPVYPCDDCGTVLHSERSLRTHRRRYHEDWDEECFICGEKFLNMHYVRAHIRLIHNQEKSFECRYCSFKCSLIKEFFKHFKVHKKSQSCKKCGKKYISPKLFQDHVVNCKTKECSEVKFSNSEIAHQIKLTKDADKKQDLAFVNEIDNFSNQVKSIKPGQNNKKDGEFKLESKYYSQQIKKLTLEPNTRNPGRGRFRTHRCYLCFKCFPNKSELEAHKEVYHHAKSSQPVRVKTDESLGNDEEDAMVISTKRNENSCSEDIIEEVQIKAEPPELTENMENVTIVLDESMRLTNIIKSLCIACKTYTKTDYRQTCKIFQNISNCDQLETLKNFEKFFPCVISAESLENPWVLCRNCALLIDKITDMEEKLKSMRNNLLLRLKGNVDPVTYNDGELVSNGICVKKEDNDGNFSKAVSNDKSLNPTEKNLDVQEYMKNNFEIMEIIQPQKKSGRPRKNEVEKLAPVLMNDGDVDGLLSSDSTGVSLRKIDDNLIEGDRGIEEDNPEKFIIAPIKSEDSEDTSDKLHVNQKINIKMEPIRREAEPDLPGSESPSWEDLERSSLKSVNSLQDEDFLVTTCKMRKDPELDTDLFPTQLLSDEVDFESHNKLEKTSSNEHFKSNVTMEDKCALTTSCSSENINFTSNETDLKQDYIDFQPSFRRIQEESMFKDSKNKSEEETISKEDIEFEMEYDTSLEENPEAKDIKEIPANLTETVPKKTRIKKRAKIQEERRLMCYRVEENTIKPWHCSNCHKSYSSQRGACDHYAASHAGQNYTCEHCKASYVRKRDLIGHYNKVHLKAKPYKCKRCNESFSMHSQLYRHMNTEHVEVKSVNNYSCHLCEATFSQKRYRDAHIMGCSTKGSDHAPHTCPHCDKSFKLAKYLRTHMRSVHSVKSLYFLCEICNKVLNDKRNLILHMKSHSGETETSCNVCHKTFSRKSYLWAHMRVHTDERPYGCNYCPKWFKQYSTWKNHERTHTGEKPYKCNHCSTLFSTRSSLSKHVQYAHFQIRDHACSVCQKGFISKAKLADHMKKHTGEKPYECPLCSRAFSRKINLRYHMYTHSDNKRFRCELCGEGFMRRTAIENHILDRHGDVSAMLRANMSEQEKEKRGAEALIAATAPFITVIGADDMKSEDTYIVVYADEDKEEPFVDEQQNRQDESSGKNLPITVVQNPASRSFSTNMPDDSIIPSYIRAVSEEVATISLQETSQFELHVSEDSSGPVYSV